MTVDTLPKQAFAVNNNLIDKGLLLLLLLFLLCTFKQCLKRAIT